MLSDQMDQILIVKRVIFRACVTLKTIYPPFYSRNSKLWPLAYWPLGILGQIPASWPSKHQFLQALSVCSYESCCISVSANHSQASLFTVTVRTGRLKSCTSALSMFRCSDVLSSPAPHSCNVCLTD